MLSIVECIPNFSEGRRTEVLDQIVEAIKSVPGAVILDRESDANHNRSVVTFVAPPERVSAGLVTVWLGHVGPAVLRVGQELGVPTTVYVCRPMAWPESIAICARYADSWISR